MKYTSFSVEVERDEADSVEQTISDAISDENVFRFEKKDGSREYKHMIKILFEGTVTKESIETFIEDVFNSTTMKIIRHDMHHQYGNENNELVLKIESISRLDEINFYDIIRDELLTRFMTWQDMNHVCMRC